MADLKPQVDREQVRLLQLRAMLARALNPAAVGHATAVKNGQRVEEALVLYDAHQAGDVVCVRRTK